jgi:hypothetical protein
VHNDSIAVSLAPSDSTEVRRYGIIGGEHDDVLKLVQKLQAAHPGSHLEILLRSRAARLCPVPLPAHHTAGLHSGVSLQVPRKPGERVKTDRRDADDWPACSGRGADRHLCARAGG